MRSVAVLFLFVILCSSVSWGQTKYEREYKIKEENVPKPAMIFVSEIAGDKKVKWFGEDSQEGKSVEAKVTINKRLHSIEFDTLGKVQDVEIVISTAEIPKDIFENIEVELKTVFIKHQYDKIQLQYKGSQEALLKAIKTKEPPKSIEINYEIVVKGRTEEDIKLYEVTFNSSGKLTKKEEIVFKNSDHLEF